MWELEQLCIAGCRGFNVQARAAKFYLPYEASLETKPARPAAARTRPQSMHARSKAGQGWQQMHAARSAQPLGSMVSRALSPNVLG